MWLFAVVALELKYRAPHAHTMLECVEVRWGTAAHIVSAHSWIAPGSCLRSGQYLMRQHTAAVLNCTLGCVARSTSPAPSARQR